MARSVPGMAVGRPAPPAVLDRPGALGAELVAAVRWGQRLERDAVGIAGHQEVMAPPVSLATIVTSSRSSSAMKDAIRSATRVE